MRINEIIGVNKQAPQPTVVQQQQRVSKVMGQLATNDQQQPPTEMERVLAMRRYSDWKKQQDKVYAQRLRQQLANAEKVAK